MIEKQYEAVLFDKDGTIFDSETCTYIAWREAAQKQLLDISSEYFNQFVGVPTEQCYSIFSEKHGTHIDIERFKSDVLTHMDAVKKNGLPFKPGFQQYFTQVRQGNMKVGLVTSSGAESTQKSLQPFKLQSAFDVIITRDDVKQAKPAPECYTLACQKLNVSPAKTIVFEDSAAGVQSALAAGCHTVHIPDRLILHGDLLALCHYRYDSFHALLTY